MPSLYEGFSLPAIEAMVHRHARSSPPTAAPCPRSPASTATPCSSCPAGDADALAAAIRRGLDDPELRARVGAAGRQRVLERWTWRRCAELTVEQYREVLAMPANVDKLAPQPDRDADADDPLRRLRALGLRPGSRVLDVGAGFGRHAFELARRGSASSPSTTPPTRSQGTKDTFAAMVDAGEIPAERFVGVLRGDATRLPFADASFDAVITSEVLEHIPDDTGALAEMVRVLRPGGAFAATVPTWLPEKINWMLSDEYHAPAAVGGHVRIYSATELKAKLRAAGLGLAGSHHAHALHSPYWWLKCAVGVNDDDHPLVVALPPVPRVGHHRAAAGRRGSPSACCRPCSARASCSTASSRPAAGRDGRGMTLVPDLPGILSADEVRDDRRPPRLAAAAVGHDPVVPRRPLRPVEPRRVGDGARRRRPPPPRPSDAYEWLADVQRPDGGWHNYYWPDGSVEEAKLDTNVCAYIATGVWHHWRCTWDRGFVDHLWPTVERALDWVLSLRRPDGARAVGDRGRRHPAVGLRPADRHVEHPARAALRRARWPTSSASPGPSGSTPPTRWSRPSPTGPTRSSRRTRWAMDWYYPVLTGALAGEAAKARLAEGWDAFAMEGCGIRCVSDEPWVTASETAECALAFAAIGDLATADRPAALDPRPPARRRLVLDRPRLRRTRRVGALPVRGAHVVHRRRRRPRRRRHRRRLAGVGAVHPAPAAGLTAVRSQLPRQPRRPHRAQRVELARARRRHRRLAAAGRHRRARHDAVRPRALRRRLAVPPAGRRPPDAQPAVAVPRRRRPARPTRAARTSSSPTTRASSTSCSSRTCRGR